MSKHSFAFGLPRIRHEPGERRDFLPALVAGLARLGVPVYLEEGYGSDMGLRPDDYLAPAPSAHFVSREEAFRQDFVLVLRCPADDDIRQMQPGACLMSMLHYPTRPARVQLLRDLGLEALSLDSITDDSGRRLVENLRAVAWNGVRAAFQTLQRTYPSPGFTSPERPPVFVTLLGAGAVGTHVVAAAIRYGDEALRRELSALGTPGIQVSVVDYDVTGHARAMRPLLDRTDLLIDATQRPDSSRPVIPNAWVGWLPEHAVLLDLSVDPYVCDARPLSVKGIEGIPHGNLDQYVFAPDDPAYDRIPECIERLHRRWAVSCYSWPGMEPKACMDVYGKQLQPILRHLVERGGLAGVTAQGNFFERAIARAQLSRWGASRVTV
jgi:alanine dehydrogenase